VNKVLPQVLARMSAEERPEVWHQAGGKLIDAARAAYAEAGLALNDALRVEPFIEDMAAAYAWADLVLCRAGALTVAELAAVGVGSVLVPFPHAVDDHQTHNAAVLAQAGAAEIIQQRDLSAERLADLLRGMTHERALDMARAARTQAHPDAAEQVLEACAPWLAGQIPLGPPFAKGEEKPAIAQTSGVDVLGSPFTKGEEKPADVAPILVGDEEKPANALPPFEKGEQGGLALDAQNKNKEIQS